MLTSLPPPSGAPPHTGRCRWGQDSAEEVDLLRQSRSALSVAQTAALQPDPGHFHPPTTGGQQLLRDAVYRGLHLPMVRKTLQGYYNATKVHQDHIKIKTR